MSVLTFILVLAAAVLVSALINQLVRGVSTPLIQIAIGILFAMMGVTASSFSIDPELFLVLFIAPLLFDEARSVDKVALWSNRTIIVSLAVGLVVVTTLVVGFTLNFIFPTVPLAAAFALGAALGPTDAVAVASLPSRANMKKSQSVLLSGESLINDASGVVSFQFAVAALTTGTFSLLNATGTFLVSFFGGIILGLVLEAALAFIIRRVRSLGLEDTTFHVLVELMTPFIIYLISEHVGVSGILAVVAAGLAESFLRNDGGPETARLSIVSSSVWRVLGFVLNGIVFVLLGVQLPHAMQLAWESDAVGNAQLIALAAAIAVIVVGVRVLWFAGINYVGARRVARGEQTLSGGTPDQVKQVLKSIRFFERESFKSSVALALAGPKGAISLSIMLTLPYALSTMAGFYAIRSYLIFMASMVIIITLLLANFVLPLIVPVPKRKEDPVSNIEATIDVLRNVIEALTARQTKDTRRATQLVVDQYNDRIERIKRGTEAVSPDDDRDLRMLVLEWKQEYVLDAIDQERVSAVVGTRLVRRIRRATSLLEPKKDALWYFNYVRSHLSLWTRSALRGLADRDLPGARLEEAREARDLQIEYNEYVMQHLRVHLNGDAYPTEHVSAMMGEVQRDLRRLRRVGNDVASRARVEDKATEVKRLACSLELEEIQRMYESGRIGRAFAQRMRENVHMMQLELEDRV